MREQFVRRSVAAGAEHHREADLLAEPRILHRHRGGALHRRMPRRQFLDPRRMDVVAAADDDVLAAAGDAQIAVLVERAEIAGHEPAALVEGVLGRRLVVEIAEHQAGAAPADLADLAGRRLGVGIVGLEDAQLVAGAGLAGGLDDPLGSSSGSVYWCEQVSVMP